jgi:hypothetical protein
MKKTFYLVLLLATWTVFALAQDTGAQSGANAATQSGASDAAQTTPQGAAASGSASQATSASANTASGASALASGTTIEAELSKTIDSRKLKVGDEITAKARDDVRSNGQVVIKHGSRLVGHVTAVKSRAKGDAETSLGVIFDHAVVKGGQNVPFHAIIQAMAPPVHAAAMNDSDMSSPQAGMTPEGSRPTAGGPISGAGRAVGGTASGAANTVGGVGQNAGAAVGGAAGAATNTTLTAASTGALGFPGVQLATQSGVSDSSVIISNGKDVRLDSGTQLMLRVVAK